MSQVTDLIEESAWRHGVPVNLALAVATRESGLDQSAVGSSGEIGVFQLMPAAASDLGVDRSSLVENIEGGVRYLREQFDRFGNWATALAAYNAGPGNVSRGIIPSSTKQYVSEVLGAAGASPADPPAFPVYDYRRISYEGSQTPFWVGLAAAGLGILLLMRR